MKFDILKDDKRYTVTKEWCGRPTIRNVARFCNEWIGQAKTKPEAIKLCEQHRAEREASMKAEGYAMADKPPVPAENDAPLRLFLARVALNREGYTPDGHYFGAGMPLYYAASECGTVDEFFRATDRVQAKAKLLRRFPYAAIVNPRAYKP